MLKREVKQALSLLGDRVARSDTAGIEGSGWCLTVHWRDGGQRLFYGLDEVEAWLDAKTPGGKREGAGRKAPLGRKKTVGVRLTPDAEQFCREQAEGFTILEDTLRRSKVFRQWLAGRQPGPRE